MSRSFLLMALALAAIPGPAMARDDDETKVLTIRPAAAPVPALSYRLLPPAAEQVPGNAAVFYHRAIQMVMAIRYRAVSEDRGESEPGTVGFENEVYDWITGPLDAIPADRAREQLERYSRALHEVDLGARRADCDWEFDARPETIDLLIPEIQETRSLARLVALKARLAIIDGDTDGALRWIQNGYALGRHVSEGPTLIQGLVGIAIVGVLNPTMEDLIQHEGTPSLYWALAALPEPFIGLDRAIEGERTLLERMLPGLREMDGPPWSVERGRRFADELTKAFHGLSGDPALDRWTSRLGLAAMIAKTYPAARESLVAAGRPRDEVEAMPTIQVVGLVAFRRYRQLSDDLYKWMPLSYWQAQRGIDTVFDDVRPRSPDEKLADPGVALFLLLQPALKSVLVARVRTDRQFAAYRCVEAIRLYADAHDGHFPPSLEAIAEAPAPLDPATNEPFGYEVDGDTATLTAPTIPGGPDHPTSRIRYELHLAD